MGWGKLVLAKAKFENMEHPCNVRCSVSPWALPLHMDLSLVSDVALCGSYSWLNNAMTPDTSQVPHILPGCVFYIPRWTSSEVPAHPQDMPKTAVISPFGLFEFM